MRTGMNEVVKQDHLSGYLRHRIIIPVYIPHFSGYFEHSLEILKLCLESLRVTTAGQASITIVSNGSAPEVVAFLQRYYEEGWIDQLLLNNVNRGRVDAVVPVARGAYEEFITITDCDVLFSPGWLAAVEKVFRDFPECGFASPVPNPTFAWYYTSATILGGLARRELAFDKVVPDADLDRFAHSIGRPDVFKPEHRESQMILRRNGDAACVGCGHFVFTIRKEVAAAYPKHPCLKALLSGSPQIHDVPPDKLGFWRLATTRAYASHMGNVPEPWMYDELEEYRRRADELALALPGETSPHRRPWTSRLSWSQRKFLTRVVKKAFSLGLKPRPRQLQPDRRRPELNGAAVHLAQTRAGQSSVI